MPPKFTRPMRRSPSVRISSTFPGIARHIVSLLCRVWGAFGVIYITKNRRLAPPCPLLRQVSQPLFHPRAGFCGGLEDSNPRPYLIDIPERERAVEAAGLGDVHLCNHSGVSGVEKRGVLQRLVLALGHAEQGHAYLLAQVVARRADEIADILDEQVIQPAQGYALPAVQVLADHLCVEVTDAVGINLADGSAAGGEAAGVVVGFQVADQRSHP